MHVSRIEIENFMRHDNFVLDFPERGIVCVVGPNGSGKSAFLEAIGFAFWGRTLRKGPREDLPHTVWRKGRECVSRVTADGLIACRKVSKKGVKSLDWKRVGSDTTEYDTTTKAQEMLNRHVGSFDRWRRTHVLSTQDVAHFSLASDSDRKKLIEEIISLSVFDAALDLCNVDLHETNKKLKEAEIDLVRLQERVDSVDRELEFATFDEDPPEEPPKCEADIDDLKSKKAALEKRESETIEKLDKINRDNTATKLKEDLARAEVRYDQRTGQVDGTLDLVCPMCEQSISDSLHDEFLSKRDEAKQFYEEIQQRLRTAKKVIDDKINKLSNELDEIASDVYLVEEKIKETQSKMAARAFYDEALSAWEKRRDTANTKIEKIKTLLVETQDAIFSATIAKAELEADITYLKTVQIVLGLRGARVNILGKALNGIVRIANLWMGRFFGAGPTIHLNTTTELKKGGTINAISLDVSGVGGEVGYHGLSSGERRRVDVSLVNALAQISCLVSGKEPGTLCFDEVFDGLDTVGRSIVVEELQELAKDRVVLLLTHCEDFVNVADKVMRLERDSWKV